MVHGGNRMGRACKCRPPRKRVGQVSYFHRHGGWWIYYRDGRNPVRRRVSGNQSEAAAAAAQVNAQLATGMPTFFSFRPITVPELRQQFLEHHEYTLRSSVATVNRYRTATQHLESYVLQHGRSQLAHEVQADGFIRYLRLLRVAPNGHKNTRRRALAAMLTEQQKRRRGPQPLGEILPAVLARLELQCATEEHSASEGPSNEQS